MKNFPYMWTYSPIIYNITYIRIWSIVILVKPHCRQQLLHPCLLYTSPAPIITLFPIVIEPSTFAPAEITTLLPIVGCRLPFSFPVPPSVTPWSVSYTHLDVYKRQFSLWLLIMILYIFLLPAFPVIKE